MRHTASGQGGWFLVNMSWCDDHVRIAVADGGAPAGPRLVADPEAETGRGLLIVEELSSQTGTYGDENGRIVWAIVPWASPDTGTASPETRREPVSGGRPDGLARRFPGTVGSAAIHVC